VIEGGAGTGWTIYPPARWSGKSSTWDKLSNFGDTLKLLVPSYSRKAVSGWTNHSCKVTSQKASEKNVGYRGSKSIIDYFNPASRKSIIVKEQRVDGSWCIKPMHLRCTLTGFERNYQTEIPSKEIIQTRCFSSKTSQSDLSFSFNPWCLTGFIDAEGSFMIRVRKSSRYNIGWHVIPVFSITLHKKDLYLLNALKSYYGGAGSIWKDGEATFKFRIESLEQIIKVVIPHFDKYPLKTQKLGDYLLFRDVVELMKNKEHLTTKGLHKIISIKASLNNGLTEELKGAFPNIDPVERPLVKTPENIQGQWIAGFTSGEGCFKILVKKSSTIKIGFQVLLVFQITQHSRDEMLMKSLINHFRCGILEKDSRGPWLNLSVYNFVENYGKIIPFFQIHSIIGKKYEDFKDWCEVAKIVETKNHLTLKGLEEIQKIKSGMNKGR
jgi:hypothetical protein